MMWCGTAKVVWAAPYRQLSAVNFSNIVTLGRSELTTIAKSLPMQTCFCFKRFNHKLENGGKKPREFWQEHITVAFEKKTSINYIPYKQRKRGIGILAEEQKYLLVLWTSWLFSSPIYMRSHETCSVLAVYIINSFFCTCFCGLE